MYHLFIAVIIVLALWEAYDILKQKKHHTLHGKVNLFLDVLIVIAALFTLLIL